MNLSDVDYFAILVAALSSFMLGGVWYSKVLFKNAWLESIGLTEQDLQSANPKLIFGGSLFLVFVAALMLSLFLGKNSDIGEGIGTGFVIGLFWVSSSLGLSYIFEQRPVKLFLINGGYHILQFSLMGLILAMWP
ncbi:hypothetical protein P20652_3226 [Pseudoalteromonas sp. BSi20652]|uniref:DUF1761 domain-containing protein n=1 Tax=Pseudoalteromonas sp. BSi20652 TaxID=388384 RepID=UPI000231A141|nr:DUF1761 domain-containing protein [Pseudoalteromonas sp. BSi20652]GAA61349.1 hypothetical protein P20652_3226 [Pseudoalteromonas sp. BSi20652]